MTTRQKIALGVVLVAATFLRMVRLDSIPVGLSNDEISIAYDAYSIRHTSRDEHNALMPIAFQSHGTYKAPFYIYTAAVSNYVLGNSEFSVRLPSAIMGVLTVLLVMWWVNLVSGRINLAIISGAMLAISPSHIYSSRMALESNMGSFYLMLGIALLTWSIIQKRRLPIIWSMFAFSFSVWSYHTEWLLTPLVILGFWVIYRKFLSKNVFWWMSIIIFGALILPIAVNAWENRKTTARANTEIILKDPAVAKVIEDKEVFLGKKIIVVVKAVFNNYSNYTKLGTLFFDGAPLLPKEDPYTVGLFLAPFLPFFIWGLLQVKKHLEQHSLFFYFWFLSCPIVPSLTIGGVNMVRNLAMLAPMAILIGIGIYDLRESFKKKIWVAVGTMVLLIALGYFGAIYYYHFPRETGENFQYGYKQAAQYIAHNYHQYDRVVVEPRFGKVNLYVGVPHLYLAYFTRLDPQALLTRREGWPRGLYFDKYQIREINWGIEEIQPKTLYLAPFDNLPVGDADKKLKTVEEIKLPDGTVEFKLMAVK